MGRTAAALGPAAVLRLRTGAGFAPTPLEHAAGYTMPFGMYVGKTLAEIVKTKRGRDGLKWAAGSLDSRRMREVIRHFLDQQPRSNLVSIFDEVPIVLPVSFAPHQPAVPRPDQASTDVASAGAHAGHARPSGCPAASRLQAVRSLPRTTR